MKAFFILILAVAAVAAENQVKYFLTFANNGSGDVDADACICQDDFEPKIFENYPSREHALETVQQACKCVDCYADSTFAVCAFFVAEVYDNGLVHFQTYDDDTKGQQLPVRRKRGLLKRIFDRFGGGISLKHNQESKADVTIDINDTSKKDSENSSSTPDSTLTTTVKPA